MNSPTNLRPNVATSEPLPEVEAGQDESPVNLRRRRAANLPVPQTDAVPPAIVGPGETGEPPAPLRRRRPAAVLPLVDAAGETPAAVRRRRAAALAPSPAVGGDGEGETAGARDAHAEGAAEGRSVPAGKPEREGRGQAVQPAGEGAVGVPPARVPALRKLLPGAEKPIRSIFNWLKVPGDDVEIVEKRQPLVRRMAVKEFWRSNIKNFNRLFLALPIITAASYLYLIAPDGYQVDTVLAIRNPTNAVALSAGNMQGTAAALGSTGQGYAERAVDESFAVVNFIRSREAFTELEKSMKLSQRFMSPHIDWFHRMSPKSDFEARYQNYLNHLTVSYSDIEGQITLTTDAYDPETAFEMAKELARVSERLVNQFNERARTDMIKLAQVQLTEAEDGMKTSMLALTDLQIKNGMLDPGAEAESFTGIISALREQVAVKRAELGALTSTSAPDSPRAVEIRNMLASLETQIRNEQNRLTGRTDALAPLIGKFKLLNIDVQLAQQKYNSAAAMLQSALLQSEHQKLYVVNIVSPTPPLESTIPKRFLILLSVVGVTFLAWLIARLILASIRDHAI